ncbi:hypothetical protein QP257_25620, partial [Escherichia coli]|nr:hypothetical protein [Escherichia coli]
RDPKFCSDGSQGATTTPTLHGIPTLLEKPTATARSDIFVQLPQVENLDFMEKNYNEHHTHLIADNFTQRMCATVISA